MVIKDMVIKFCENITVIHHQSPELAGKNKKPEHIDVSFLAFPTFAHKIHLFTTAIMVLVSVGETFLRPVRTWQICSVLFQMRLCF